MNHRPKTARGQVVATEKHASVPREGEGESVAEAWALHARALATWTLKHLANRRDTFGHYIAATSPLTAGLGNGGFGGPRMRKAPRQRGPSRDSVACGVEALQPPRRPRPHPELLREGMAPCPTS